MTLDELRTMAWKQPPEVRDSRRRAVVKRMQRMPSRQRERDLIDLGWREPDAGWPDDGPSPLLPVIGYRDLGGEG